MRESATLVLERRTRRGRTRLGDRHAHLPAPRIPADPPARTGSQRRADGVPDTIAAGAAEHNAQPCALGFDGIE